MTQVGDGIRLTAFSHGAGCACKLSPTDLRTILGLVHGLGDAPTDPNLLVGFDTSDDAAVYRLRDDLAIVVTTDFFTPIVDDPYDWGRVAATNALSDVYAMGGAPILALNLVAWPREGLPFELLARVLDGGNDVVRAAGAIVGGGHSIDDTEPKFGLAVVGTVDPARVLTNRDARAGDALVLTKPLGLGVISTALKRGVAPPWLVEEAIRVMTTLNAGARDAALAVDADAVHAATDVTGFGLLGHLREMLVASGLAADVDARAVPVIDGVRALLADGLVAGGTQRNHAFVDDVRRLERPGDGRAAAPRRRADVGRAAPRGRARRRRSAPGRAHRARHPRRRGRRPHPRRQPRRGLDHRLDDQGMTSIPSSASSCGRGFAPSDARSMRPLRNRPMSGMLCTSYSWASAGSSSMLTFTTL